MDSSENENEHRYPVGERATLEEHQAALFQMLCDLDEVCRKIHVPYQLFAGTALGAIRHKGFIPWDDDLDVVMMREDYERFLLKAPLLLDSNTYFVQTEFSAHWPVHFSKLRKNNTACIERYIPKDKEEHQGIYIDIFPCDNLSDYSFVRIAQFLASKVVIAKSLDRHGYITNSYGKKLFMRICRCLPMAPFRYLAMHRKATGTKSVHTFFGASSKYEKSIYPRKWFMESWYVSFEGRNFPVSAYNNDLLTVLYGDYWEPLPASERGQKVHAELVDLHHSYKEYSGIQETMNFQEYTRSIR